MADVVFGPVTGEVIDALIPALRPIDRLELDCMAQGDPAEALARSIARARRSCATYIDGQLTAIIAVNAPSLASDTGCPWALTTTALDRPAARRAFTAGSAEVLDWVGGDFRKLWNLVASENRAAIRWLQWLGFEFPGKVMTVRGHEFRYFERVK